MTVHQAVLLGILGKLCDANLNQPFGKSLSQT